MSGDGKGLSTEVSEALSSYVEAGCPGDVNAYLDRQGLSHPPIEHERRDERTEEAARSARVICDPGYVAESMWIPDRKGGHYFWYCVPA